MDHLLTFCLACLLTNVLWHLPMSFILICCLLTLSSVYPCVSHSLLHQIDVLWFSLLLHQRLHLYLLPRSYIPFCTDHRLPTRAPFLLLPHPTLSNQASSRTGFLVSYFPQWNTAWQELSQLVLRSEKNRWAQGRFRLRQMCCRLG